jgi:hypothetical protein
MKALTVRSNKVSERTFQEAICHARGIGEDEFEQYVLERCLHPAARLLYPAVNLLSPRFFQADREMIRQVRHCRALRDLHREFAAQREAHGPLGRLLRRVFRLRISGRSLMALAAEAFPGVRSSG